MGWFNGLFEQQKPMRKKASVPTGLAGYEHEGFHGLASPDSTSPSWSFSSPEYEKAYREHDQARAEFNDSVRAVEDHLGPKGKSIWDHRDDPEVQKYFDHVGHQFENDTELRKLFPDSMSREEYAGMSDSLPSALSEGEHRQLAHQNLVSYAEKILPQTSCPHCAGHLVADTGSNMKEYGAYGVQPVLGLFDHNFPAIPELQNLYDKYPGHLTRDIPLKDQERLDIAGIRDRAHHTRQITNAVKTLSNIALSGGSLCPLHVRIK